MKQCANCFSTETWIHPRGYESWLRYKDGFLCHKCYVKLISNPLRTKESIKKHNKKRMRIRFRDKQMSLNKNPKTGYCSMCKNNIFDGSCKRTNMHHLQYHVTDPLKDAIELCASCHRKQHIEQDEYSW